MMSLTQQAEEKLFYYGINLKKRVRPDNPLRRILEVVDFGFVREAVAVLIRWKITATKSSTPMGPTGLEPVTSCV
jgi:hypothetical protein